MTSREDILHRVRSRLGRTEENAARARTGIDDYLARHPQGPRFAVKGNLADRFRKKSEEQSSTIDLVTDSRMVPAAVARYLEGMRLSKAAVVAPDLAGLPWREAGLAVEARGARDADLVGITGCYCAIAETGTLMMLSGPDTPAAVSLLPETHIAVVPVDRIVSGMEEAWNLLRAEKGTLPRAVNFVSGPSRTGDIEQTIVLGAHGPYRVHLILVGAAPQS